MIKYYDLTMDKSQGTWYVTTIDFMNAEDCEAIMFPTYQDAIAYIKCDAGVDKITIVPTSE